MDEHVNTGLNFALRQSALCMSMSFFFERDNVGLPGACCPRLCMTAIPCVSREGGGRGNCCIAALELEPPPPPPPPPAHTRERVVLTFLLSPKLLDRSGLALQGAQCRVPLLLVMFLLSS